MTVIKFCLHSENHTIKKLLLLFWEVVRKTDAAGNLLPEMILVCNAMKNNLVHPNEFIRGATLRFLCNLKQAEILESLVQAITANLEHRHSYVRKNAALCVFAVFDSFPDLIPDAPELVEGFLYAESNAAARRNAFLMLLNCDQARAIAYLNSCLDNIASADESFQLVALELVRRVCKTQPHLKASYVRSIYNMANHATSNAVAFEGANTLIALSAAPTALRAAVSAYTRLLQVESDNNVKLIILARLAALRKRHEKVLQEMLMDIMRALSTPNLDIRRQTLRLALQLVSQRNVVEVVSLLKKELLRADADFSASSSSSSDGQQLSRAALAARAAEASYRHMLIDALRRCAIRFTQVTAQVVDLLMNYLSEDESDLPADAAARMTAATTGGSTGNTSAGGDDAASGDAVRMSGRATAEGQVLISGGGRAGWNAVLEVIFFVREIVEEFEDMRPYVLGRLIDSFDTIRSASVYQVALWVLGEYATSPELLERALDAVRANVGPLPIAVPRVGGDEDDDEDEAKQDDAAPSAGASSGPVVLSDGTYAQQSASLDAFGGTGRGGGNLDDDGDRSIRYFLLRGNHYLAVSVANNVTKMLLRRCTFPGRAYGTPASNKDFAEGLLMLASLLRLTGAGDRIMTAEEAAAFMAELEANAAGAPKKGKKKQRRGAANKPTQLAAADAGTNHDAADRIRLCMRALLYPRDTSSIFLVQCRSHYSRMLQALREAERDAASPDTREVEQVDDIIQIRQLKPGYMGAPEAGDDVAQIGLNPSAAAAGAAGADAYSTRLNRVYQLTGFGDEVYAEAQLNVVGFDIVLDVLVVNQTDSVLQNLGLELHTSRDLKLVDRPRKENIAANGFKRIQCNIKVSATESGVIFGNIVYDAAASGVQQKIVVLNSLHMDICDYMRPSVCSDQAFRTMWAEFEWENKLQVNTKIKSPLQYLHHILKIANMQCLTPEATLAGTANFLAANLAAKSVFGEDALMNVSVEKQADGTIGGYIRIRSKTQGIALSLGDKITQNQRGD